MQQQQNMNQTNQPIMPEPPNIVTEKDSLYLTDMLSWNLLAMKKAYFFANQCQDPEIKAAINKAGQMHQKHYQKILSHLHTGGQNQPTNTMNH
ncbi:hypothetical protein OEV98_04745 [Caldibacillus lycopersici]|uniref:Spore coat protein n=1 Tax=Perspicuibacillus lycopersici TaxID=1325689 RepID=A0AAE3IR18_9BACI|nr:hypothetical protein [Perspicuibacillus lycopersici]MCU9612856.1 hypothetical protein [Perspicuibacillus lycopersici]